MSVENHVTKLIISEFQRVYADSSELKFTYLKDYLALDLKCIHIHRCEIHYIVQVHNYVISVRGSSPYRA